MQPISIKSGPLTEKVRGTGSAILDAQLSTLYLQKRIWLAKFRRRAKGSRGVARL